MNRSRDSGAVAHGLTELHIAVISGNIRRVSELVTHDNKTIIEAGDEDGTTPLMTAVLAGRLAIFRLLLRSGAAPDAKDRRGRSALDYSKSSRFKTKLRSYRRLGLALPSRRRQHRKRALIAKILRRPTALQSCREAGTHECSRSIFYKDRAKLKILRPDMTFKIAKRNLERATSGFIASATNPEVKTAATSGWQPNSARGSNVLDNVKYIQLVQEFSRFLNFTLIRSQRDNNGAPLPEHSGRFVASHTEKKLAVFWVMAALKAILDTTDFRRMRELREAVVPECWRKACIFLDHTPCGNCWDFLHRIKQETGVAIHVESRPFLVKGFRQGPAGCINCRCDRCTRKHGALQRQVSNFKRHDNGTGARSEPEAEGFERAPSQPNQEAPSYDDMEADSGGLALQGNADCAGQSPRARETRGPGIQPTSSEPPKRWKQFFSELTGAYAKPVNRSLGNSQTIRATLESSEPHPSHNITNLQMQPSQILTQTRPIEQTHERRSISPLEPPPSPAPTPESPHSVALGLRETASTIAGRSGFFATPGLRSSVEVHIPLMSPEIRADYDLVSVSDMSGPLPEAQGTMTRGSSLVKVKKRRTKKQNTTIQQSTKNLNLRQFAYNGRGSPAIVPNKRTCRRSANSTGWVSNKATKTAKARKTRGRQAKNERLVARSAFARAVEHHRRQRAEKA